MHPRSLLRQLTREPIAHPCDSSFDTMTATDSAHVRHCAACDREVFSLSDMTELEAELRLLNARDATPCIRYARDHDGSVLHRAPPRALVPPPGATARALVVASALGGSLFARDAAAQPKDKTVAAPVQCVMLNVPAPATPAPAPAAAPASGGAAASAPAAAAPAPAPPPPPPLAGAPMPPQEPIAFGNLTVRSKVARELFVHGLTLKAPLTNFRMTPGVFTVEVVEANQKRRKLSITITVNKTTTIDLDKR